MGKGKTRNGISRRAFLKTSMATVGACALVGTTSLTALGEDAPKGTDEVKQVCCYGNCMGGCTMNVHLKDGKAYRITPVVYPEADLYQLCQRGHSQLYRVYDPRRIKYPMKRKEGTERGAGEWERISWDEAIDQITSKWKEYQEEYGHDSIVFAQGSGNVCDPLTSNGYKLTTLMGASNMNAGEDVNGMSSVRDTTGIGLCYLGGFNREYRNANNIFIWGTNPTESRGVHFHWLTEAIENGTHTVVIDPNFTITASKCDEHIPIRPGTDALLAFAMMNEVLDNGWQDEEFLKTDTVAPFLVCEVDGMYLRGSEMGLPVGEDGTDPIMVMTSEGQPAVSAEVSNPVLEGTFTINGKKYSTAYTLLVERIRQFPMSEALKHCDLSEETIKDLAKTFADGPTCVTTAYGLDHYVNGFTAYHAIAALLMLTGNLGKPGAGFIGQGAPLAMGTDTTFNTVNPESMGAFAATQFVAASQLYGPLFPQTVATGKAGDRDLTVKSLYIYGQNTLGNQCNRQLWIDTFNKIDTIVVADVYMTETTKYADYILPATHYFEQEYIGIIGTPYMRINERAIEPSFEAKPDFEIFSLLGHGMGLGEHFTLSLEEFNRKCLENPLAESMGIDYDRLKKEKYIMTWPFESMYLGEGHAYGTATGKAQFYFEGLRPSPDWGQEWDREWESLPYWEPPHEAWYENELINKYPLHFTTERAKFKVHTMFTYVPEFLELDPEPIMRIHPDDAAERGLKTGDYAKVYNDRGYVVTKLHVSTGNRKGVLIMDHGWQDEQFKDGHYQSLSNEYTHAHYACNAFFDILVQVEKAGEE